MPGIGELPDWVGAHSLRPVRHGMAREPLANISVTFRSMMSQIEPRFGGPGFAAPHNAA